MSIQEELKSPAGDGLDGALLKGHLLSNSAKKVIARERSPEDVARDATQSMSPSSDKSMNQSLVFLGNSTPVSTRVFLRVQYRSSKAKDEAEAVVSADSDEKGDGVQSFEMLSLDKQPSADDEDTPLYLAANSAARDAASRGQGSRRSSIMGGIVRSFKKGKDEKKKKKDDRVGKLVLRFMVRDYTHSGAFITRFLSRPVAARRPSPPLPPPLPLPSLLRDTSAPLDQPPQLLPPVCCF